MCFASWGWYEARKVSDFVYINTCTSPSINKRTGWLAEHDYKPIQPTHPDIRDCPLHALQKRQWAGVQRNITLKQKRSETSVIGSSNIRRHTQVDPRRLFSFDKYDPGYLLFSMQGL